VLQRLKGIPALSTIPVVVISGLDRVANEKKAIDAGADAYIQKPADHGELLDRIRRLIGE
jgi:DNA-binding response OmpR family regulator